MSLHILKRRLEEQHDTGNYRKLQLPRGIDYSSNDYLDFATDKELQKQILKHLKGVSSGSRASRLLRGHSEILQEVENLLADFSMSEKALIFPSGYQANLAIHSSLFRKGDVVFSDEFNHASIIDGLKFARPHKEIYRHCDLEDLEVRLKKWQNTKGILKIIVTESLFSMEGHHAPLSKLIKLAKKYDTHLIVDEAHATGLFGNGAGLCAHLGIRDQVLATIHTGGKALGVGGAWVATHLQVAEYMVNFSRPLIFSTAPTPMMAVALASAIQHWSKYGHERASKLLNLSRRVRLNLRELGLEVLGRHSPILPILIGDNHLAIKVANHLQALGMDIRAIRPPTVPEGTARLRLTLGYRHCQEI